MYFEAIGPKLSRVQITEDMIHLPVEDIDHIWVHFALNVGGRDLDDETLTRLFRNSNKVKEVHVGSVGDDELSSPQRIELLRVIIARAEKLEISHWQSDLAYSCLTSCLSQQPNGLTELRFSGGTTRVSASQAQLLFEGVGSSSSLQVLSMRFFFVPDDEEEEENYESFCTAFLDALRRNRSLKTLDFCLTPFVTVDRGIFARIFKAAILDTKIETLSLSADHRGQFNIPSNLLIEALCNDECMLKELNLLHCALARVLSDDDQMPNNACNTSIEILKFKTANLDLSLGVEIARRCRSLVSLEMVECDVGPRLSLLDPLLIGDEQLQSLHRLELFGNGIDEDQAIAFFRKLPQMTCIREVRLLQNPSVFTEASVPVLVDAIQRSKSVEHLDLNRPSLYAPMLMEELGKACSKIDRALRRNQERRLTEEFLALVRSKVLPEKLWPLVLERAQRSISLNLFKTYPYTRARAKQPSESVMQIDLVNRLLKEKMFQDHLY